MADTTEGKRLGNISLLTQRHGLKLENVINEIILRNQWHFRAGNIRNNIVEFQQKATSQTVIINRDRYIHQII
jgi:hypothetical protein